MDQWRALDALPPRRPELLRTLVGKLTQWPLRFLEDEDLASTRFEKEHYATRVMQ